jgi:hypothetical protein
MAGLAVGLSLHLSFSYEDLFIAGLGFDIAGAYLVSRGLLQPIPQLATAGSTMWALEQPKAPYAVDDRIRGSVGLVALVVGFVLQVAGYTAVLARHHTLHYGKSEALTGAALALCIALIVCVFERSVRPRWRKRILIRVARFDHTGKTDLREKPIAHVLRGFGEHLKIEPLTNESNIDYCLRVFHVEAEEPNS